MRGASNTLERREISAIEFAAPRDRTTHRRLGLARDRGHLMSEKLHQNQEKFGADEKRWRDVGAGLSVLDLHEENGRKIQLVRLTPGGRILAHKHEGTEVSYIIKGSLVVDGIRLRAGEVLVAPAGSIHRDAYSAEGCEMVLECSPNDELLRS